MTPTRTLSRFALAMMALPVVLGALLCFVRPAAAWLWIFAMLILPASWLGIREAVKAVGKTTAGGMMIPVEDPVDARKAISFAMAFASLVIAIPLAARLADALGLIDPSLADAIATRWTNVVAGGYFVLRGNRLPKILTPLSDLRCAPATMLTLQRGAGWIFILAGLAYAVLWLALPVRLAEPIGAAVIVAGILAP
ncbi:MAG TPA: hypothetical protein VIJ94_15255, partial [Caulobacteraceae bacterium]